MTDDKRQAGDETGRIIKALGKLPPNQRHALLNTLGIIDVDMLKSVGEHLSMATQTLADDEPGSEESMALSGEFLPASWIGRRIGPYELIEQLGSGGMGAVFLGRRVDGQFEQNVAVKVIKPGVMSDVTLRRFMVERQILARLDHPNIARLLDGGVTSHGVPYFVMTFIQGETILDYCDDRRLSLFDRLELFKQVCSAVQYAHRNLIVHRDLKPGNILVTAEGSVKLLDFGIAKLLTEDSTSTQPGLTQTGQMVATPAYASPEQLRGDPVSTSSDVYALGLLLFELLTGRHAFDVAEKNQLQVMHQLLHEDPSKPSTALTSKAKGTAAGSDRDVRHMGLSPKRLRRILRGDLDTICMKALQREPDRRYLSVERLLEDVTRFLKGRPLLARPDNFWYRMTKFVARNRLAVFSATAIVSLLLAFSTITAFQSRRISRQADRIAVERDKAQATVDFLVDLFGQVDPDDFRGEQLSARDLLDQGAKTIPTTLQGQEDIQAELMTIIGHVYLQLGLYESAHPLLQRALEIRRKHLGNAHVEISESLHFLASYHLRIGDLENAADYARRAAQMNETLEGRNSANTMRYLSTLGLIFKEQGLYKRAESLLREVHQYYRSLPETEFVPQRASALSQLASLCQAQGAYTQAEDLYRQSLEIRRKHFGKFNPRIAESLNNLGTMYSEIGNAEKAQDYFRRSLEILEQIYRDHPHHPSIISAMNNQAGALKKMGQLEEAQRLYRDVLDRVKRQFGDDHMYVAGTKNNLALTLGSLGDFEAARQIMTECLDQYRAILGADHPNLGIVNVNFGKLFLEQNACDDALPYLEAGTSIFVNALGVEHPNTVLARQALARCLICIDRLDDAEILLHQELERLEANDSAGWPVVEMLRALARISMLRRDWEPSIEILEETLKRAKTSGATRELEIAEIQMMLGESLLRLDRFDEAEAQLKRGHAIRKQNLDGDNPELARDRDLLEELAKRTKPHSSPN